VNIWVIGPGLSLKSHKHLIEKLNDKKTMVLQKVFPHCINYFGLNPTYWTWFDPHGVVDGKLFLQKNLDYKIKAVLPSPMCNSGESFRQSWPHGKSFIETKMDSNMKNWKTYEDFLTNEQLDIDWLDSISMAKLWFDKSKNRELAIKLSDNPEFRFNEFDKVTIGTHYSMFTPGFEENTISRLILPMCHKMGFKKVFVLGFDGVAGRFYGENPLRKGKIWKTSPYVGKFSNLKKWIQWKQFTDMEIFSVVPCLIDKHIPSMSFEKALEMDN